MRIWRAVLPGRPPGRHARIPQAQWRIHGQRRADPRRRALYAGAVYAPALDRVLGRQETTPGPRSHRSAADLPSPKRPPARCPPAGSGKIDGAGEPLASRSQDGSLPGRIPVGEVTSAGSSLKFCVVAEGKADVYPRFGPTMEWDTAAGDAVLRAAGGLVLRPTAARSNTARRSRAQERRVRRLGRPEAAERYG